MSLKTVSDTSREGEVSSGATMDNKIPRLEDSNLSKTNNINGS